MNQALLTRAAALLACVPLFAGAQGADTSSPQRPLPYRSVFSDYRPYQDIEPGDWRRLNDAVGAAAQKSNGGHAGHGAPAPAETASSPQTKPAMPKSGHGGMGGMGGTGMQQHSDQHQKMHGGQR